MPIVATSNKKSMKKYVQSGRLGFGIRYGPRDGNEQIHVKIDMLSRTWSNITFKAWVLGPIRQFFSERLSHRATSIDKYSDDTIVLSNKIGPAIEVSPDVHWALSCLNLLACLIC